MSPWLAAVLVVIGELGAGTAAYAWGYRRGIRLWREEQRQREIEARLLGRPTPKLRAAADRAVVRSSRVVRSHRWKR